MKLHQYLYNLVGNINMKLDIVGAAYEHQSQDVNFQKCINMYLTSAGPEGRGRAALVPTPGLTLVADLGDEPIRGMYAVGLLIYVVVGDSIYKLTVNNLSKQVTNSEIIGTIGTTVGSVGISSNPTQVIFVDGSSSGYIWTEGTTTFSTITDGDFDGGTDVQFLNGYFVVNVPDSSVIQTSALNDGTSWDALDIATVESGPDDVVGLSTSKGELWAFGTDTTEIWYDAANVSGIPLSPRTGLEIQIGCQAPDSITRVDDFIIWLDDRGFIVQSGISSYQRDNNSAYQVQIISTPALANELSQYTSLADGIGSTYTDRGNIIYQISFPNQKKTWAYNYTTKLWHQLEYHDSTNFTDDHHLLQYTVANKNIFLGGGVRDGKIYVIDEDVYTDAGEVITRTRTTKHNNQEFQLVGLDVLEIRMESDSLPTGDGSDPQLTLRYSNDGGHTWSHHLNRSTGKLGEYAKRIRWNRLGIGSEWVFELTFNDPIKFSIIDAAVTITEVEQ